MTLDELRSDLLGEHALLRNRLAYIRRLTRTIERGEKRDEADRRLRKQLVELRTAMERHLEREDMLLRPVLATIDAWGKEREAILAREHQAEHAALFSALDEVSKMRTPYERAIAARVMARELSRHMDEEEEFLLHPDVLTDHLVKTTQLTD